MSSTVASQTTQPTTADVFKALGHPARVNFIQMLGDGEKCVCDLVDSVDLGWSTVSRHLSVLKDAGIISDEKRGLQVFYKISLPCVSEFVNCLENGHCKQPESISTNDNPTSCDCK